jgi:hypothetical protein
MRKIKTSLLTCDANSETYVPYLWRGESCPRFETPIDGQIIYAVPLFIQRCAPIGQNLRRNATIGQNLRWSLTGQTGAAIPAAANH